MWSVFKYVVESPESKDQNIPETTNEIVEDVRSENILKNIQNEIEKNAENYIISLHYIEFPIIIFYGSKYKDTVHLKRMEEYVEIYKEAKKILLMNKEDDIKGFYFLRNQIYIQKEILKSLDQETFDKRASESGLEPYIINDLRTIWKNKRLEQMQKALVHHVEKYYKPNKEHPLYKTFITYLENIYKRGVDRFKTFICIGSTFIGKSVFFSKFVVPEEYYIYHSNFLEYSKMPNQPQKIFRILDDINWEQVTSTELKSLMNRNISSVNIKYGYEYIFPLIPIIIMNGEDYKVFRQHFTDIWEFIERNAVIYPSQKGREIKEEDIPLFTDEIVNEFTDEIYLFNEILEIKKLKECDFNNMNEWIKNELNKNQSWKYDTKRYIQIPVKEELKIPNPELNKKLILKQYEEFLLKRKQKEMEEPDEKKPRSPWYKTYNLRRRQNENTNKRNNNKYSKTRFDDIEFSSDEDDMEEEDEYNKYNKKRYEMEEDTEESDYESETDESDESDEESGSEDKEYMKGFIQI